MDENEKQRVDQRVSDEKKDGNGDADDTKAQNAKATVHYEDNVSPAAEHSHTSRPVKFDSSEPTSRAPSPHSENDYDEDNYDWSTEDDLEMEDETKKFEKQMGVKQERSRFMKCVFSLFQAVALADRLIHLRAKSGQLFPLHADWFYHYLWYHRWRRSHCPFPVL